MEKKEKYAYSVGFRVTHDGRLIGLSGRERKCRFSNHGYYETCIRGNDNKLFHLSIHRLQAYQKFGDTIYHPGVVVRHLNGNCKDNTYDNIAIGTHSDNMNDRSEISRAVCSYRASSYNPIRYSNELIKKIKSDRKRGLSYSELMKKYSISSKGTISYICNHQYKTISERPNRK